MSAGSSEGGSSDKQENGDFAARPDRPLKKARFAWQVKGKHHLKNDNKVDDTASSVNQTQSETERSSPSSDNEIGSNENVVNAEQNLEILGDYLLKTDFSESKVNGKIPVADFEKIITPNRTFDLGPEESHNSEIHNYNNSEPINMMRNHDSSLESAHIANWQAQQIAKGFVDNTINRVLESWMETRIGDTHDMLPVENDGEFLHVTEFINNIPNDNSVENEGILMAISAHGLQNNSNSGNEDQGEDLLCSANAVITAPLKSPIPSPKDNSDVIKIDQQHIDEGEPENECCISQESETKICALESDYKRISMLNNETSTQPEPFEDYSEAIAESEDLILEFAERESLRIANMPIFYEQNGDEDFNAHLNFMEAAVTYAIQNNGLTAFSANYG